MNIILPPEEQRCQWRRESICVNRRECEQGCLRLQASQSFTMGHSLQHRKMIEEDL